MLEISVIYDMMKCGLLMMIYLTFMGTGLILAQSETSIQPLATYSDGDIKTLLSSKMTYPKAARKSKISGDVIFSFKIGIEGVTENLRVASSPSPLLTEASLNALKLLNQRWNTAEVHDPDQEFLHIFRFRITKNTELTGFTERCAKQIRKEKWEKALRVNDLALIDNQYDSVNWLQRARILEALDREGVVKARERANNFGRQVVSNVVISVPEAKGTSSSGAQTPIDF